jgi:hypothetical protein
LIYHVLVRLTCLEDSNGCVHAIHIFDSLKNLLKAVIVESERVDMNLPDDFLYVFVRKALKEQLDFASIVHLSASIFDTLHNRSKVAVVLSEIMVRFLRGNKDESFKSEFGKHHKVAVATRILVSKGEEEGAKRVPISSSEELDFIANVIGVVVLDHKVGLIIRSIAALAHPLVFFIESRYV